MHKSVIAAIAAFLVVLSFSSALDAQTRRRPVRRATVKKRVVKRALIPSGAVKTATGLTYLITHKGTGRLPKRGETVLVHYTGMLTSGIKFDSSLDRNEPIAFKLGAGQVIKGWDEGIAKLHIGDRAILIIPATIAYGSRGAGNGLIPPGATLVFIVELVDAKELALSQVLSDAIKAGGVPAMRTRFQELKAKGLGNIYASEGDLNRLGYSLLRLKQMDNAIAVFKLIVEEYPNSANAYDSLGEAYLAAGQKQLAIESYEKALAIDPKFNSATKALEKLRAEQ
ncbi:MAG: FKBP-type peptidyl-prolyl cis-trans isomerase [Acidobacteriota bacterium]